METYRVYQQENKLWAFRIFINGEYVASRVGFYDYTSAQFAAQQFILSARVY